MAVFKIQKTENYTVMSNKHLQDKRLTLKAKGLLSVMLSLPQSWDYSVKGLVAICKEGEEAVNSALKELKETGYLILEKVLPNASASGRIEWIYNIYEEPQEEKQGGGFQGVEKQGVEFQGVENPGTNKVYNNKYTNNKVRKYEMCVYKKFIDTFNMKFGEYVGNANLTPERMDLIDKYLEQFTELHFFSTCCVGHYSPFLRGETNSQWEMTFDWLIIPENAEKVFRNYYKGKQ